MHLGMGWGKITAAKPLKPLLTVLNGGEVAIMTNAGKTQNNGEVPVMTNAGKKKK